MPWTNASIVLNSRDATGGTYNALKFNATNQNIIQGQIHSISVNEVNFPYDIPNVQAGFNVFYIFTNKINPPTGVVLDIVIPPGFYSGTELATAITNAIVAAGGLAGILPANLPVCVYSDVSNLFSFTLAAPTVANLDWSVSSPYTFPQGFTNTTNTLGKDILSIMGFQQEQNNGSPFVSQAVTLVAGGSAPLQFTQYVDICSPLLCQYQYFRDGSTTNLARRSDVICRLYISNNVAIQEQEGERPFVIQRQFNNARVMRWSAESSVGQIDVNLFDDVGQPLQYTWLPRPYQITFNCYEQDKDSTTY
jgi:hypothetical protein